MDTSEKVSVGYTIPPKPNREPDSPFLESEFFNAENQVIEVEGAFSTLFSRPESPFLNAFESELQEVVVEPEADSELEGEGIYDDADEYVEEEMESENFDESLDELDDEFIADPDDEAADYEREWEVEDEGIEYSRLALQPEPDVLPEHESLKKKRKVKGIYFKWRWKESPIASNRNIVPIGLEFGGDDKEIGSSTPGRVKIFEVSGIGLSKEEAQNRPKRLIATFHGTFHRNPKVKPSKRVTFEIHGKDDVGYHDGMVSGFDPECLLGIDAFVMTFVNREFIIYLPFLLDTRSGDKYLVFRAVAEIDNASSKKRKAMQLGQNNKLKILIRRERQIETTTKSGGSFQTYKGQVIGNLILHHEDFLVQGVFKDISSSWSPGVTNAKLFPISAVGIHNIPFDTYLNESLKIFLMKDLLIDLTPDSRYLEDNVREVSGKNVKCVSKAVRKCLMYKTKYYLLEIFTDAGFAGVMVYWGNYNSKSNSPLVEAFKKEFKHRNSGSNTHFWELKNSKKPYVSSFWTFYVTLNNLISPVVGKAEKLRADFNTTQGNLDYVLPYPVPIGSGNKKVEEPVSIRTGFFNEMITTDGLYQKKYNSKKDLYRGVHLAAARLAIVIAHEIGHSLGLMHEIIVTDSGPYREKEASVLSIMSSKSDEGPLGFDLKFSNQAKTIWQNAFKVSPTFDKNYFKSKTWEGEEWKTVSWVKRKERFHKKYNTMGHIEPPLGSWASPPPFAKNSPEAQKGTFISHEIDEQLCDKEIEEEGLKDERGFDESGEDEFEEEAFAVGDPDDEGELVDEEFDN